MIIGLMLDIQFLVDKMGHMDKDQPKPEHIYSSCHLFGQGAILRSAPRKEQSEPSLPKAPAKNSLPSNSM